MGQGREAVDPAACVINAPSRMWCGSCGLHGQAGLRPVAARALTPTRIAEPFP